MSEADGRRLDHVVLPRRLPGLALLERYYPSPADNLLDAELSAHASPRDTVLDPWAGTGWTARRAIAHGMRAIAADASPFAQLAAVAFLSAREISSLDAAFAQLASARRVDVPLRQHIEELYATRCASCRRPVVGEQFIWPRDADAPGRKVYRCASCDASTGGPEERVGPVDAGDLAKLGIERDPDQAISDAEPDPTDLDDELPPAPTGLTPAADDEPILGEPGGPPAPPPLPTDPPTGPATTDTAGPRFASTIRPDPIAPATTAGVRQSHHYQQLRDRFPVLDGRDGLVDELLSLYTPRNLYALHAISEKIDTEVHDAGAAAAMRLALAGCLLPASRLNGYPGRVASLRIAGGHVRQPASRHQREVNVWRLFEEAYRDVRTAIAAAMSDERPARFAADYGELHDMAAANVLWIRCRPGVVGQYLPGDGIDMVLAAPGPPATIDELSFEYLATGWLLGRSAAETLRLEPLFGPASRTDAAEPTALRHGLASAAGALKPGGRCTLIFEGDDPDRLLGSALAAVATGLELVDVVHRESRRSGNGIVLHLRKPSGEDRLRAAVRPAPLRLGTDGGHLSYPELAGAIERAVVALLRDRGEPAGLARAVAAIVEELARSGLLRRLAASRSENGGRAPGRETRVVGGPNVVAELVREELWRDDHPSLVRIGSAERPMWWLREPELAEQPLADRVEWATYSILSTAGKLDEVGFFERIYRLFPGLQAPDEELVRACLAAYVAPGERGSLATEDALGQRSAEHGRMIAILADYGHRLGLRVWISRREQDRPVDGRPLATFLSDEERRVYLPLVLRAPADQLGAVDALWYLRGRLCFLFEVEWTAMLGEAVLRRGRAIPPGDDQARFLVLPAERSDLVRLKLERSPWLRAELERQNWHILKWQHLETLAARESAHLDWLEPVLGLDPLIERGGEQLTMFGE
jgi:hypothetical protein